MNAPTEAEIEAALTRAEQDTGEIHHRVRYAELLRQSGRIEESAEVYRVAARAYAVQEDWLRAFALARALLHLDPTDTETQRFVTSMYASESRSSASSSTTDSRDMSQVTGVVDGPLPVALPGKSRNPLPISRLSEITEMNAVSDMEHGDLEDISHHLRSVIVERGEAILREGERSSGMFFILRGEVNVSVVDDTGKLAFIGSLDQGAYFGEFSILGAPLRRALVEAQTRTELLDIDDELFDLFTERSRLFSERIRVEHERRMIENIISRSRFLRRLPTESRERLILEMTPRECAPRELIVREGDPTDRIYILARGNVDVYRRDDTGERTELGCLQPGQLIRGVEIVEGQPYARYARSVEASTVYWFSRDLLMELATDTPDREGELNQFFASTESAPSATEAEVVGSQTQETETSEGP